MNSEFFWNAKCLCFSETIVTPEKKVVDSPAKEKKVEDSPAKKVESPAKKENGSAKPEDDEDVKENGASEEEEEDDDDVEQEQNGDKGLFWLWSNCVWILLMVLWNFFRRWNWKYTKGMQKEIWHIRIRSWGWSKQWKEG